MRKDEDEQRIEERLMPTHHQSSSYDITGDNIYYPVDHKQLRHLLGDILTILDGMVLPERAYIATRANITQSIWRWWDEIYSNTTTSYKGCIAPIVASFGGLTSDIEPSNRWGYKSEEEYIESITPMDTPRQQSTLPQ